ncbi:hypothetical protein Tco_0528626 [Tanacetum coccineum]
MFESISVEVVMNNFRAMKIRHGECDAYVGFGFGYDESSDEYKVVGISGLMNHGTEAEVKIYSLRYGYWKRLGDFTCVSFDLATETFGEILHPVYDEGYKGFTFCTLGEWFVSLEVPVGHLLRVYRIPCSLLFVWFLAFTTAYRHLGAQMVRRGRQTRNSNRRDADRGNDVDQRDPRDVKIERLQQRIRDLEIQQESPNDETESEPHGWDVGGDEDHNPFGIFRQNFRGPNREDPLRNMGMKIEIPEFEGKAHPDDFID